MKLKPWDVKDALFVCYMRNGPLRRWFRQDTNLELEQQKQFMVQHPDYHGYILYDGKTPVAIIALYYHCNGDTELCWVGAKHFKVALDLLIEKEQPDLIVAPVFATNPLLKDLLAYGFEVEGVTERAYYKKDWGMQDVIRLRFKPKG